MKLPARAGRATGRAALVAAAAMAAAPAAACETRAAGSHFAEKLRPSVTGKLGAIDAFVCPERIPIKLETVFSCDVALASGHSTAIVVTLSREGELSWRTRDWP